ncbi:hypothetical protein B5X24_HaOG213917 [Helicoverpa armigera]|uniref:ZAD domain-containing protein n=1 Tax=Helicoverpa armigera TaxID=29058 RepID=A0A2W1BA81_HELAM|nr:hypothetical protein B5X24_HaOG213917 [Helicoverpa armigera]
MCEQLCRLCLSEDNLSCLFTNTEENVNFSHVLLLTTGLKIERNDGLPQNICSKCKDDVHLALDLRNRSLQSETTLKHKYNSSSSSYTENIVENNEIISNILENHDISIENCEDYDNIDGFPELKVEIECDRIEQDGGETKWLPEGTVKKLTKKEKRQQYLDLVDGELDPEGPVKFLRQKFYFYHAIEASLPILPRHESRTIMLTL